MPFFAIVFLWSAVTLFLRRLLRLFETVALSTDTASQIQVLQFSQSGVAVAGVVGIVAAVDIVDIVCAKLKESLSSRLHAAGERVEKEDKRDDQRRRSDWVEVGHRGHKRGDKRDFLIPVPEEPDLAVWFWAPVSGWWFESSLVVCC